MHSTSTRHKIMMLSSRLLVRRVPVGRFTGISSCFTNTIRHHMNHGGGGEFLSAAPPTKSGPREPLELGLDAARATQNILRLLESSTHGVVYSDALDTIWHSTGKVWARDDKTRRMDPAVTDTSSMSNNKRRYNHHHDWNG